MKCSWQLALKPHLEGSAVNRLPSAGHPGRSYWSSRGRAVGIQVQCVQALERPTKETRGASRSSASAAGPKQREVPDSSIRTEDLVLPKFDRRVGSVELIVAGAGPSGLAVAERVSQAGAARWHEIPRGPSQKPANVLMCTAQGILEACKLVGDMQ